jgi:hypothetical protein
VTGGDKVSQGHGKHRNSGEGQPVYFPGCHKEKVVWMWGTTMKSLSWCSSPLTGEGAETPKRIRRRKTLVTFSQVDVLPETGRLPTHTHTHTHTQIFWKLLTSPMLSIKYLL